MILSKVGVNDQYKWKTWFAWKPVLVFEENNVSKVWLQIVQRRSLKLCGFRRFNGKEYFMTHEYRFPEDTADE